MKNVCDMLANGHIDEENLFHTIYMAYKVACTFDEVVTEEFVRQYLDHQVPADALCELGLACSVLYPSNEERTVDNYMYSFSHGKWLEALRHLKLTWSWKGTYQVCREDALSSLMNDYYCIQRLAHSPHPPHPPQHLEPTASAPEF